jgi:hypothetical protein
LCFLDGFKDVLAHAAKFGTLFVKAGAAHPMLAAQLRDGRNDLDTNAVERMFKLTILLRKNARFLGSDEGAQAWGNSRIHY